MTAQPRIGLIGAGAVGTLLAAALLNKGQRLHWLVRNPARRAQLSPGLGILLAGEGNSEQETAVEPRVISTATVDFHTEAAALPPLDWLLLAVKAQQVQPLLDALPNELAARTVAVVNGLHERPGGLGLLYGGAYLDGTGTLVTSNGNRLYLGALSGGPDTPSYMELAELLSCAWLHAAADTVIEQRMWEKLSLNCIVNPLTAVLGIPNGELLPLLDSPLLHGMVAELSGLLHRVVPSSALSDPELLREQLRRLLETTAGNRSSMLLDLKAGRETEIEYMNLAVAARAEQLGLACPLTKSLGAAVIAISHSSPGWP